jgi:hypothetical protein
MEPVKLNSMIIFSAGDMLVLKLIKSGETISISTLSSLISDGERADMNMIEREVKAHRKEKRRQIGSILVIVRIAIKSDKGN